MDFVVEHDERAEAAGFGICGQRHGIVEVRGAVGAGGRGGTHGTDQHHRLVAMNDEAEEVGGLFHRVGAVGDDDAVHILVREDCVDAGGQLEPHLVVHRLAADVGHLLAAQVGQITQVRDGLDEVVHREAAGFVADFG